MKFLLKIIRKFGICDDKIFFFTS